MECSRLKGCPFYNDKLHMEQGVGAIYKKKYCMDNFEQCARYQVAQEAGAENIPDGLYPNMHDVAKEIIEKTRQKQTAVSEDPARSLYIARQPIFTRDMGIFGYELLYRQGAGNLFIPMDDDQATTELIYNSFFVFGLYDLTEGTKAFINFSKDLLSSEVPSLLPKKNIVIEILERRHATQATLEACRYIKSLGYSLALDDFIFDSDDLPLLEFADIVKVEFPSVDLATQAALIKKHRKKIKFLAEKLETHEDFLLAMELGYDYFQGYFFCKPSMISSKDITSLNINLFNILKELNTEEPNIPRIATIIQGDLGLSLKLLKLSNSVYYGARNQIKSIMHALSYIGLNELYQWISIMLLKDYASVENAELIKMSLIRAKFMELICRELHPGKNPNDCFFTGMFSFIDVLLNQDMETVLRGLPFSANVKDALLGKHNEQRKLLNCVINYETANLHESEEQELICCIDSQRFTAMYIDAIKWVKSLNY